MRIRTRIRSLDELLATSDRGSCFTPAITQFAGFEEKVRDMGFSWPLEVGESVLPPAHCGTACSRNACGWNEKHYDRGFEDFTYLQRWKWKMKRGLFFDHGERMVTREKQRRPRTLHPPFSMEVQVLKRDDGAIVLAMPGVQLTNETKTALVNAINVLVEIFGGCFLLSEALRPVAPIRRAHWKIVPQKARSWAALEPLLRDPRAAVSGQQREVFKSVLESIIDTRPTLCAVGQQGFTGNVLFGFTDHRLFLLESVRGRATVGIEAEWSDISQLPIVSLFDSGRASFVIPHSPAWRRELAATLQSKGVGI